MKERIEEKNLKGALKCNGYLDWILWDLKNENNNRKEEGKRSEEAQVTPDKERAKKIPVVIQDIKGFSEQIKRGFERCGTPTYFKPINTLRQLLVKPKDPVSKENVVGPVYAKIKCEKCEVTYVRETERSLKSRFNEHRRPSSTTSEVSKHIHIEHPEHSVD